METWNLKVVPEAFKRYRLKLPLHENLSPSKGLGRSVAARVKDGGTEQLLLILRWFLLSPDHRAVFLRDNGHGLQTLVRPVHWDEYLGLATVWSQDRRAAASGGRTPAPTDAAMRRSARLREIIDIAKATPAEMRTALAQLDSEFGPQP